MKINKRIVQKIKVYLKAIIALHIAKIIWFHTKLKPLHLEAGHKKTFGFYKNPEGQKHSHRVVRISM